jgi:uncharacterized protein DUF6455
MNPISVLVLLALGGMLLYTVLTIVVAIVRNLREGQRFRQTLAEKVRGLRLRKMLATLRIDLAGYLHRVPVVDIEKNMQACKACQAHAACDEALADDGKPAADYGFCPNYDALKPLQQPEFAANLPDKQPAA